MANLVVFVATEVEQYSRILDVWEEVGAKGATIIESTGLRHVRSATRDDLPLLPSLSDLLGTRELHHRTLFTVVDDDETLRRVVDATRRLVGSFERANAGLLFVVPVTMVFGLHKDLQETPHAINDS